MSRSTEIAVALLSALTLLGPAPTLAATASGGAEFLAAYDNTVEPSQRLVERSHPVNVRVARPRSSSIRLKAGSRDLERVGRTSTPLGHALRERYWDRRRPDGPRQITVWFAFDSAHIRPHAHERLLRFAARLSSGTQVTAAGHADRSGTNEYNDGLSWCRARSVSNLLEAQGLVPTAEAFGERRRYQRVREEQEGQLRWDRRVVVTVRQSARSSGRQIQRCAS